MFVDINIAKPVYGNFVYIRDTYIKQAIKENKKLRTTVPNGIGIADPQEWQDTGKKLQKIFKIPNNPMTLYGNHVNVEVQSPAVSVNCLDKTPTTLGI